MNSSEQNLLIINFEMNDASPVLAWQYGVALELAKHYDHVTVLTGFLKKDLELPENMEVHNLRKMSFYIPEVIGGYFLSNLFAFTQLNKRKYQKCFIHMAVSWVYYLHPFFKFHKIPTCMWYAHGSVSKRLKLAHHLVGKVLTSTKNGFRLESNKLNIIGQGIDSDLFIPPKETSQKNTVIYIGRISRRKNVVEIIEVFNELKKIIDEPIFLELIGPCLNSDDLSYKEEVLNKVKQLDLKSSITLFDGKAPEELVQHYKNAFVHLNLSDTGSLDKTILEALSCGCPVVSPNDSFKDINLFGFESLFTTKFDQNEIVNKLLKIKNTHFNIQEIRDIVVDKHDRKHYIKNLVRELKD